MMAYPLLITMVNVWNGDCVRTPFCYRVRRHSVSPSQCHSASKPLFTQKLQNGFLRHFFLFLCGTFWQIAKIGDNKCGHFYVFPVMSAVLIHDPNAQRLSIVHFISWWRV